MGRTKKIDINSEGFRVMVMETYNDILQQKNDANRLFKDIKQKLNLEADDENLEEIPLAGPTLVNLLKVVDSSVDKKLKLLKIFQQHIKSESPGATAGQSGGKSSSSSMIPSGTDRNELTKMLKELQGEKVLKDGK